MHFAKAFRRRDATPRGEYKQRVARAVRPAESRDARCAPLDGVHGDKTTGHRQRWFITLTRMTTMTLYRQLDKTTTYKQNTEDLSQGGSGHSCSVWTLRLGNSSGTLWNFIMRWNLCFSERISCIALQAHNSTTAIVSLHCCTRQEVLTL